MYLFIHYVCTADSAHMQWRVRIFLCVVESRLNWLKARCVNAIDWLTGSTGLCAVQSRSGAGVGSQRATHHIYTVCMIFHGHGRTRIDPTLYLLPAFIKLAEHPQTCFVIGFTLTNVFGGISLGPERTFRRGRYRSIVGSSWRMFLTYGWMGVR